MPGKRAAGNALPDASRGTNAIDHFLRGLNHPLKPAVETLRAAILAVSPRIGEEIKWNSPSFYLEDHFATINIGRKTKARPTDHILVILHRGARATPTRQSGKPISDPEGLVEWLGKDRGMVMFESVEQVEAHRRALQGIVRQWIATL